MAGSTLEEWKLFAIMDPAAHTLDRTHLAARLRRRFDPAAADSLIDAYEKARVLRSEPAAAIDLFSAIETDRVFRMPAVRLAEVQSRRNPRTYNYLFTWRSPAMGGALGACHALELGFVFGANHLPGKDLFSGSGPAAEKLASQMQDAWLAFARSGDPGSESLGAWPAYDETRRATMVFGATSRMENAPLDDERRAWNAIPDSVLGSL